MKKILITGASGMLGACLVRQWMHKYQIFATDRDDFANRLTTNFKSFDLGGKNYHELIEWSRPDVIVHCAAITNVDYCEENFDDAMAINGDSVRKMLEAAPSSKLIYISTDAVFPNGAHLAKEAALTKGESIYGRSKEYGEGFIKETPGNSCIVRTTIVGKNININKSSFSERIVSFLKNKTRITLFGDVLFTPISIWDFAEGLEWAIENPCPKVLHISGSDIVTKYDFGYLLGRSLGLDVSFIIKGSIADAMLKAARSKDQTMDVSLYERLSGRSLPGINETIKIIAEYFRNENNEKYKNRQ